MARDAKSIKKAFNRKKSDRSDWDEQMQEIAEYVFYAAADQNRTFKKYYEKRDRLKINDSTAVLSARLLASAIHGSVMPPNLPWVDFRLRNSKVDGRQEVKDWIGKVKKILQQKFNESNLDEAVAVFFKYLVVFGTAGLFLEERFNEEEKNWGFHFTALSPREIYFEEDRWGYAETVYRPFKYTLQQIKERWPEALERSRKLSTAFQKNPDEEIEIVHYVSPKRDGERTGNKNHQFVSKYIACEEELVLATKGFFTFPYMIVRWERIRGQEMGNSPARDALPDIRTLNDAVGLQLESYDKALNPPTLRQRGIMDDDLDLSVRAVNDVDDINGIKPYIENVRYDVAQFLVSELRESIKRQFFADQIQISQEGKTPPSATQVQASLEIKNRILGPMFGGHKFELLNNLIDRSFDILNRKDLLPEIPVILEEEAFLDPEYVGPLARAQKMAQAEQVINYLFTRSQMLGQIPPEILSQTPEILFKVDFQKVEDLIANSMGISDLGIFRSEDEVNEKVVEFKRLQDAQQQLQGLQQGAGAVKDFATAQKVAQGG